MTTNIIFFRKCRCALIRPTRRVTQDNNARGSSAFDQFIVYYVEHISTYC